MLKQIKEKIINREIGYEFNGYSIVGTNVLLDDVYKEIVKLEHKNQTLKEEIEKYKLKIQEKDMKIKEIEFKAKMEGVPDVH